MSNSLAIAAVTATLRNLLDSAYGTDPVLAGTSVTTLPPDKARDSGINNQVNIFLYHTVPNAAWRNMDIPLKVKPGEKALPPLALNLYYIITAYGQNNDDIFSHRLLGRAMSVIHDHSLLGAAEIESAFPNSGLPEQFERVRITPETLSSEEMYKLWSAFQTNYRISAAYQASVVLIESSQPVRASLPVLKRGDHDQGISSTTSAASVLNEVRAPLFQPAATLGDDIVIAGQQLQSQDTLVRFTNLRLDKPIEVNASPGSSSSEIRVHLNNAKEDPTALAIWVPGFYTVSLVVKHGNMSAMVSNDVPFALAPSIVLIPPLPKHVGDTLTLTCAPRLRDGQRVLLIFGNVQVIPKDISTPADIKQPTTLKFDIPKVDNATYTVRLRVDGVDSIPVIYDKDATSVPAFDPKQQVTIT